mgnify:FL=1
MPNVASHTINTDGTYSHIYNYGVEGRTIFNDRKDYETFQGFLKEYLTPPPEKHHVKQTFTVNGRTYHGVPHQPKNYFKQIELVAYRLNPTGFHLVLHEKTPGALEKFMRSLSTRYSIYYNATYQHTGSLFAGPYKSVKINTISELLSLTQHLHRGEGVSSYEEFLGRRTTSWIKPAVILSRFEQSKNAAFKGTRGYQQFVEHYTLKEKEQQALERILLTSKAGQPTIPDVQSVTRPVASADQIGANDQVSIEYEHTHISRSRIPEFIGALTVFVLLVTLGIRNIQAQALVASSGPTILGIQISQPLFK